jgi:argininosuccinate lyase
MHLADLQKKIVFVESIEWGFLTLSDKYTTGSSLMPQKKNPDMAELIRGKSGRAYGNYLSLAVTLKGLPLSYNRDLQEDKEPVFDSFDTYIDSLYIFTQIIKTAKFRTNRFNFELNTAHFATDLADYLVKKQVPFREAHGIIGRLVKFSEDTGLPLNQISLADYKLFSPKFERDIYDLLSVESCLKNKITLGSPNPKFVKNDIERLRKAIN